MPLLVWIMIKRMNNLKVTSTLYPKGHKKGINTPKGINKRGQEGLSTTSLLVLILGAVALVVIIIGFTQGWSFFTDLLGKTDIDIAVIKQKCETILPFGVASYCLDKIEIGNNNYINCGYANTNLNVIIENSLTCSDNDAKAICRKIKLEEGENYKNKLTKIKVNGKPCGGTGSWDVGADSG